MARPIDSSIIKNLLLANGMKESHWNDIENHIENTKKIHHSIIFFILDPFIAIQLIPERWINMFPTGFLECMQNLSKNLQQDERIALFRRAMHYDIDDGLYQIIRRDIHIDNFLQHLPECFLDIILNNPNATNKLIEQCKLNKQDDSFGYTKLLLLK